MAVADEGLEMDNSGVLTRGRQHTEDEIAQRESGARFAPSAGTDETLAHSLRAKQTPRPISPKGPLKYSCKSMNPWEDGLWCPRTLAPRTSCRRTPTSRTDSSVDHTRPSNVSAKFLGHSPGSPEPGRSLRSDNIPGRRKPHAGSRSTASVPHGQRRGASAPTPSPHSPSRHDPGVTYELDSFFESTSDIPEPFRSERTVSDDIHSVASSVLHLPYHPSTVSVYTCFESILSDPMEPARPIPRGEVFVIVRGWQRKDGILGATLWAITTSEEDAHDVPPPYNNYFVDVVGTRKYCYNFSH